MDTFLYAILAALYAVLLVYGLRIGLRDRHMGARYLLFLVTASLIWDNGIVALGRAIGEGTLLERLNLSRFWLHAFVTPLLAPIAWDIAGRAGHPFALKPATRLIAWIAVPALILLELFTSTLGLELTPSREYGALRYVPVESSGPPIMVLLILIPLVVAGILVWRRRRWPWMFAGTALMAAGSAIPFPIESSAAVNVFEWLQLLSLWLTIDRLARDRADGGG
ncbi:hypothetical protein [Cohnella sp. JJ-181]|uniref:hypothetical protein n=1 Tax=Cohnella rhizoplanae TaxID=2974897 RepID=UPI0022FF9523|nr:hypothetical protein [Cohnella sp. JJ-181]CAI6085783.1 hypothetical protein COHCIP112018_04790 [Cohnella sp. JJ-181]